MYELKIFLLKLQTETKNILGVIIGFDLEESIQQAESIYKNAKFVEVGKIISWQEFKSYYDVSNWPEEYRDNELGMFDLDECYDACMFVRDIVTQVLDRYYNLKIDLSAN